jgi:hypothetical protein
MVEAREMPPRRMIVRSVTVGMLLLTVACGGDSTETTSTSPRSSSTRPSTVPPPTLIDMHSTLEDLDATDVAAQAIRPEDLEALLDAAGFSGGVERSFVGGTGSFSRVVARTVAFGADAGAAVYLSWLREHVAEILGATEPVSDPQLPAGAVSVRHLPNGCCPKEVPVYLVAWQRDELVLSVEASGQRARAEAIFPIVRALDREE